MADNLDDLIERFEEVVRENERLHQQLDLLDAAVGHTVVLVFLATAVRAWEQDDTPETRAEVLRYLHEYDRRP